MHSRSRVPQIPLGAVVTCDRIGDVWHVQPPAELNPLRDIPVPCGMFQCRLVTRAASVGATSTPPTLRPRFARTHGPGWLRMCAWMCGGSSPPTPPRNGREIALPWHRPHSHGPHCHSACRGRAAVAHEQFIGLAVVILLWPLRRLSFAPLSDMQILRTSSTAASRRNAGLFSVVIDAFEDATISAPAKNVSTSTSRRGSVVGSASG